MIYLLTRPFAWAFNLLMWIVRRPTAIYRSTRDRKMRKHVKTAATAAKQPPPPPA